MSVLLEVKNLKKYFKTPGGMLHAVDDVSFAINEGDYLALLDGKLFGTDRSIDPLLSKLAEDAKAPRPTARSSLPERMSLTLTIKSSKSCAATCR